MLILLLTSLAVATPPPARTWLERPTAGDFTDAFPRQAFVGSVSGSVLVACHADGSGRMAGCQIVRERPAGYGFGAAALPLMRQFRSDDAPGTPVVLSLSFGIDGRQAPSITDNVGDPAYLLLPSARGPVDCPTRDAPSRRCALHPLHWTFQPSNADRADALALGGDGTNVSTVICSVTAARGLTGCAIDPASTAGQRTALERLLPSLTTAETSDDGLSSAGAQVGFKIDWAVLRAYAADARRWQAPATAPAAKVQ